MSINIATVKATKLTNPDLRYMGKYKVRLTGKVSLTSDEPVWHVGFKYHFKDESWKTVYVTQAQPGQYTTYTLDITCYCNDGYGYSAKAIALNTRYGNTKEGGSVGWRVGCG